jgi:hypothetical protein
MPAMQRYTPAVLYFLLGLMACSGGTSTSRIPTSKLQPPVTYPAGIKSVLGISATPDFLADTVTAATDRTRLAKDGFRIVRMDVLWQYVETTPGVWDWSQYDRIIDDLIARGFEPLLILDYGNPIYFDGNCPALDAGIFPCLPDDQEPFYRFARRAAERYADRVKTYEVWNEPNGWFRFWPTVAGGDPAAFAVLAEKTAEAIHLKCAECKVLSGGLVYLPSPITRGQLDFMKGMQDAIPEVFTKVDGIGFHAYTFYPPIDPPETKNQNQVPFDEALQSTRDACACETPLWITETGWTAVKGLTETERAQFAVRSLLMSLTQGVQSWLWWSVRDVVGEVLVAGPEGHFGLMASDGTPHQQYSAIVRTMKELGDATEVTDLRNEYHLARPYEWALRFQWPDGRTAEVFWYGGRGEGRRLAALNGKQGLSLTTGAPVEAGHLGSDPILVRP